MLKQADIKTLFTRLQAANPEPTTELIYNSPFELLIAVILSAQATDASVNKATQTLYPIANTPQAILDLGKAALIDHIKHIGLYQSKAKHVLGTCQQLLRDHQGQVPDNRIALEALPGVGRKTANVVLNTVFGQPTMAVDTHIFRVSRRLGLADGKTVRAVEDQLLDRIPSNFVQHAHHWLILHGRYTCTAKKPNCSDCLLHDLCPASEAG